MNISSRVAKVDKMVGEMHDVTVDKVDVVVFDLGNVLISWDPHPAIAKAVGSKQAAIFLADEDFAFMEWNNEQDAGRSWDEAEALAVRTHPQWARAIRGYRANFPDSIIGEIEDSVRILRELHAAGIRLFALTNWSSELFPVARGRFDFLGLFEDIVVSGDERVRKPDPRIFEILKKRIGGGMTRAIFIDDSPANTNAAADAGLDAILFSDTGHLRKDLGVRGLLLPPT